MFEKEVGSNEFNVKYNRFVLSTLCKNFLDPPRPLHHITESRNRYRGLIPPRSHDLALLVRGTRASTVVAETVGHTGENRDWLCERAAFPRETTLIKMRLPITIVTK